VRGVIATVIGIDLRRIAVTVTEAPLSEFYRKPGPIDQETWPEGRNQQLA